MNNNQQVQPIYILPEGSQRTSGRNAQSNNIMAAKIVAETVRTTLGPRGMDKMLVDSMGDVIVTNDGVTILEEMSVEHPAAKMIVEVAKTQEDEIGDGTTSAVVIAGELLKKAEALMEQNIHPTVVAKGYRMAAEKAHEILEKLAIRCTEEEKDVLKNIAITAMTGKGAESSKELLAELVVDSVLQIIEKENGESSFDKEFIKIEKKVGSSIDKSELVKGVVVDKERVHSSMPRKVADAKIALIDSAIEIKDTETDAKISITSPDQIQSFIDMEEKMLLNMVQKIVNSGANVVFCQKGIDEVAQHYLSKNNIFAVRRLKKSDMEKLSKATGAKITSNLDDLSSNFLGKAGIVEEKIVGDEEMVYVRECPNPKAVTLLLRGSTEHVIDEVKRAVEDAIGDVSSTLIDGFIVGGAGSIEIELSRHLKKFSSSLSGREQLAVNAFAESVEVIPRTLAENGGLDPIDVLTELKAAHDSGEMWAGIDVFSGKTIDSIKEGIVEPLKIKTQAISSASEVAVMILRIDDVIASGKQDNSSANPQGGMPPEM
ncbi:MAG: thermosome subunit alpha [Candidatus Woesearchaeota archaeon]